MAGRESRPGHDVTVADVVGGYSSARWRPSAIRAEPRGAGGSPGPGSESLVPSPGRSPTRSTSPASSAATFASPTPTWPTSRTSCKSSSASATRTSGSRTATRPRAISASPPGGRTSSSIRDSAYRSPPMRPGCFGSRSRAGYRTGPGAQRCVGRLPRSQSRARTVDWTALSPRSAAVVRWIALPISLGYSNQEVAELLETKRTTTENLSALGLPRGPVTENWVAARLRELRRDAEGDPN